ncbi:polysaccharide deacetylase family protein [Reinekea sp.]|uniref:polysaccharide deacetylase family protein n=1 Tax=Reinekea sp. TaxID=1970455 RepID=UPI002A7F17A7|nr:polysaccharide deacetylase family protein [Reinekea sp.]
MKKTLILVQKTLVLVQKTLIAWLLLGLMQPALAADHFNILVYHHVSEHSPASTSVTPQVFRQHLQFFKDQQITVMGLADALAAVATGTPLSEKTIAITFDDGYRDIYDNAFPLLQEFDYPFTVFVATDPIDQGFGDMLSWAQLRSLHQQGVTIANHSSDHAYLVRQAPQGSQWRAAVKANIEHAQQRLTAELGAPIPLWLAYPYGEFNFELQAMLKEMGFLGFGQHSGGVWSGTHAQAIPRFAAAGIYANTATLATKIASHPMPVDESALPDMLTADRTPHVTVRFTDAEVADLPLNCFLNGTGLLAGRPTSETFRLDAPEPLSSGRHRFNCTARSTSGSYYYWFSKPWLIVDGDR